MALVLLSGTPGSGKTTLAEHLKKVFTDAGYECEIVSEPSVEQGTFDSSRRETIGRSDYKSAIASATKPDRIVIADGMNFIKGYRYELWCIARETGVGFVCAYCQVEPEVAFERSKLRYPEDKLRSLISRLETPDETKNKWDKPMVLVKDANDPAVWKRIMDLALAKSSKLAPKKATAVSSQGARVHESSDRIVNDFCQELLKMGNDIPIGVPITVMGATFTLKRPLEPAKLKRAKRDFCARVKTVSSSANIPQMFADSLSVLY